MRANGGDLYSILGLSTNYSMRSEQKIPAWYSSNRRIRSQFGEGVACEMQVFAGRVGSSRLRVNPYPYVTCDMPLSTMRGHKLPRSNRAGPNDIMLYCSTKKVQSVTSEVNMGELSKRQSGSLVSQVSESYRCFVERYPSAARDPRIPSMATSLCPS